MATDKFEDKTMATDKFKGATMAYTNYYSFIKTLINEFGKEKTFALMTKSDEERGIRVGKAMKSEAGDKKFDIYETLLTIVDMASEIGGIDRIVAKTKDRVATVTQFGDCPVYEAAKATGMDDQMIEEMCRASACVFLDNVVRQLNPDLTYKVSKFRDAECKGCLEEIVWNNN